MLTRSVVEELASNEALIEIGRQAIEDMLVEFRDNGLSMVCGNGFSIRNKDGELSAIIRMRTDIGLKIALNAIAEKLL